MASDYKMGIISIEFDGRWTENVDVWVNYTKIKIDLYNLTSK